MAVGDAGLYQYFCNTSCISCPVQASPTLPGFFFLLHNSETLHNTQCQIFNHNNTFSKYIQTTVLMPGAARKTRIYVHRLSYIVHTRNFDIFNRHMHVSHLCHNTHCINIQHLSYEPQHVNNNRQRCKIRQPKTCLGHGAYPDCVF